MKQVMPISLLVVSLLFLSCSQLKKHENAALKAVKQTAKTANTQQKQNQQDPAAHEEQSSEEDLQPNVVEENVVEEEETENLTAESEMVDVVEIPEHFFTPSNKFEDSEITIGKIQKLFGKYDENCEEIIQVWIGEKTHPNEWHTFKNSLGVPEFMRTNRYFSVIFRDKDGVCRYSNNNLAMRRDHKGGGKFDAMRIASVRYRTTVIDCSLVSP